MKDLRDSPAWFAWYYLGLDLYQWQVDALECVGQGVRNGKPPTSLVAANGSGKTARVIAPAILWFLWRYPEGRCPITSGSWMQVENQLFPALHSFKENPVFKGWTFNQTEIRTPKGGKAIGFSTDNPGRAEGWHPLNGDHQRSPVFYVTDEAKTIPDPIFVAIGRCTLSFQLIASSPGGPFGKFYRTHHEESGEHLCIKAASADCPHISKEKIARDMRLMGEDDPDFRSMHLAEFTEDQELLCLSPQALAKAIQNQPAPITKGEVVAFCDFAAGGDENVLAVRRGNSVSIVKAWRDKDTAQAVREFARLFGNEGLDQSQIWGDADGIGTSMIDWLAESGWRINRFHGGIPCEEKEKYVNLISSAWIEGCRDISMGRIHIGQPDPTLSKQLTTRKTEWAENGRRRVMPKPKMKAEGLPSPDRADAVLGAICCGARLSGAFTDTSVSSVSVGKSEWDW